MSNVNVEISNKVCICITSVSVVDLKHGDI